MAEVHTPAKSKLNVEILWPRKLGVSTDSTNTAFLEN